MEMLRVENVSKTYGLGSGAVHALQNVSFSVRQGEFVAIVGSSGSGKSTLLHILGGVDKPGEGKVYINGEDIYAMDDKTLAAFRCRSIGMVYQFFNLIPVLNVEENIGFPMLMAGGSINHEKIKELLVKLNIKDKALHMPNQLSGGQQQRVAVGRAIVNDPLLILADEPTGNLDAKNGRDILNLLWQSNSKNGHTLIIITHSQAVAAAADRIIQIEDGKIVKDTSLEEATRS
ncbi:MAG: ABC transporter ATP-binding protein [Oscillospiraceae bacterium]|jgi:putative ABC transport system ATP-binding protein|nr:ABC transporter ATP-binding protein [Oscillospiraceae bacterium]